MNLTIRIFLIILLILFAIIIIKKIKNKHISMRYASIWLIVIFALIIISIFPNIVFSIAKLLHFEAASNMVFLLGFFLLSYISFSLTLTLSKQNEEIKELIQEISILKKKVDEDEKRS